MPDTICMDFSHISIEVPQSALTPQECPVVGRLEYANGLWSVDTWRYGQVGQNGWTRDLDDRVVLSDSQG